MDFLKLLFGDKALTFAELEQAINAHNGNEANKENQIKIGNLGGGEYVSKAKHDALQAMLNGKEQELTAANGLIDGFKKSEKGNEQLQTQITDYQNQVTQLQAQLKETQISSEFKIAALAAGAKPEDIDYLDFKLKAKGETLELGEDGHIKGIDNMISGLKTQFPNQFEQASNSGGVKIDANPLPKGDNRSGITREEFAKMGYQSRLKLKQEQPEVYAQMTGKENI